MKGKQRAKAIWIAAGAALAMAGIVVPLLVLADSAQPVFTATLYSDVIRFEADGAASLRVTIYDLSEHELWSSGLVMGEFVDWDRSNAYGERLANGYYMYLAQGWDSSDQLVLSKTGKVVLLPGDQVELRAAPVADRIGPVSGDDSGWPGSPIRPSPMAHTAGTSTFDQVGIGTLTPARTLHVVDDTGMLTAMFDSTWGRGAAFGVAKSGSQLGIFGVSGLIEGNSSEDLGLFAETGHGIRFYVDGTGTEVARLDSSGRVGIGTAAPARTLHVVDNTGMLTAMFDSIWGRGAAFGVAKSGSQLGIFGVSGIIEGNDSEDMALFAETGHGIRFYVNGSGVEVARVTSNGDVGIGATDATDKLTIQGESGNLIACYPDGNRAAGAAVFRIEADGDVYADGTVYSSTWQVGAADVAERINTSEWVEAGDVVEIDPDHVGFFRKARGLYSRRVAGIISTSPGVILGNDVDDATDEWDDGRPVLAIAGRVPVKASVENGPIAVGDLLVSSSISGVAMKGDPAAAIGAVVGKAMEPLDKEEGVIMAQVTLR